MKKIVSFTKDNEAVIIKGERFTINQEAPSVDLTAKWSVLIKTQENFSENVDRRYKIIELIQEKLDEAILNKDMEAIFKYDEELSKQKEKTKDLGTEISTTLYELLEWLIGREGAELIRKEQVSFTEVVSILTTIGEKNLKLNDIR